MISKIIRILIGLLGAALGTAIYIALVGILPGVFSGINDYKYIITIGVALVFGIIFYAIAPLMLSKVKEGVKLLDKEISKYPQSDILLATIGLIVGLVIAYLIVSGIGTFINLPIITAIVGILVYLFMGYIGIRIALKSRDDLFNINKLSRLSSNIGKDKSSKKDHGGKSIPPKVLDTSVIIDGRIADICRTGFVEGADARVQTHSVDNCLRVEALHFGVGIQLVEVAHAQGEVSIFLFFTRFTKHSGY